MEPTKRELRQQKREIKRAGGKRRRRQLKQALVEHPEDAPYATFDFGRFESARLNGLDHDTSRWQEAVEYAARALRKKPRVRAD